MAEHLIILECLVMVYAVGAVSLLSGLLRAASAAQATAPRPAGEAMHGGHEGSDAGREAKRSA